MSLEILYEDNHIIAVNKSGGDLVQADRTKDRILPDDIKKYLKVKYNKPGDVFLGVVHRIDRPVSGVVLFGRTSKATTRLNVAFRDKTITKTYLAIVEKKPPKQQDSLAAYLSKNHKLNKSYIDPSGKGKFSELSYRWLASSGNLHLLEVIPVTGRHHQIRVMLSHIGCVIKGDLKYGSKTPNSDGNISLHALSIRIMHPVRKEELVIVAKPPTLSEWNIFSNQL